MIRAVNEHVGLEYEPHPKLEGFEEDSTAVSVSILMFPEAALGFEEVQALTGGSYSSVKC